MKLNEAIVLESYKDAERIFGNAFTYMKDRRFNGSEERARMFGMIVAKRFQQQAHRIPPETRDISMWIGLANRVESESDALSFYSSINEVITRAEEMTPAYQVVGEQGAIRVTHLENFAAVKSLCGRMSICIRSNERDFEAYSLSGALFLIEVRGRKFIYEYSTFSNDGTIWNERNEEVDWDEFFDSLNTLYIPSFNGVYGDDVVDEALDHFSHMWRLHRRGGL